MRINTVFILLCFFVTAYVWFLHPAPEALAYSYTNLIHNHAWWTPVTALFVHASPLHLLGNVLFMALFGYPLEKIIGESKFAFSFIVGGVLSFLFSRLFYPPNELEVGASGAICTLIAMLMLYNPWKLSFLLIGFPMPLGVAGLTYVLLNFWEAHMPKAAGAASLNVAYYAHILGFVFGIFFSAVWNPDWKKNLLVCVVMFILYYAIAWWFINHFVK